MLVDGKNRKSGVRASRERAKLSNERQVSPQKSSSRTKQPAI